MDETGETSTTIDAPVVWIGYGIDAPEFNWNDYKDVDVKGQSAAHDGERAAF